MALIDNLVSYWKLDEASGNAADSKGSNTLVNTNVTYAAGKLNNAAVFDNATDYLSIADASQSGLDITGDMSFSTWVSFSSTPGIGSAMWLMSKFGASGNYGYRLYLYNNGGALQLWFECSANGSANTSASVNWTPTTATWYNIVIVYTASAGSVSFYVNNSQVGTTKTGLATSIYNNNNPFYLGSINGAQGILGTMDETGIWSRALTADDLTQLYGSGTPPSYETIAAAAFTPKVILI